MTILNARARGARPTGAEALSAATLGPRTVHRRVAAARQYQKRGAAPQEAFVSVRAATPAIVPDRDTDRDHRTWATSGCPWPSPLRRPAPTSWEWISTRRRRRPSTTVARISRTCSSESLAAVTASGNFRATTSPEGLSDREAIIICLPTPLDDHHNPDLRPVVAGTEMAALRLAPGALLVLESTTYPGTTREVIAPILERGGARVGTDVFLAFSPERVDPGNEHYGIRNTPKIVGGVTARVPERAAALYGRICDDGEGGLGTRERRDGQAAREHLPARQHRAGQRDGHLLPRAGHRLLGRDPMRASTKPFGFQPFWPGPGRAVTASRSTRTTCPRGAPGLRLRRVRGARPGDQRQHARLRRGPGGARPAERGWSRPSRARACCSWGWPTKAVSPTCARARRSSWSRSLRRRSAVLPRPARRSGYTGWTWTSVPLTPEAMAAADAVVISTHHRTVDLRVSSPTRGSWSTCVTPCARRSTAHRAARHPPTSTSSCQAPAGRCPLSGRGVWNSALTNSPHVRFFRPILRRLDDAGVPSVVTARDFAQTLGLLELYAIPLYRHRTSRRGGTGRQGHGTGPPIAGPDAFWARHQGHRRGGQPRLQRPGRCRQAVGPHSTVLHDFEGATTMHRINFRLADKVMVPQVIPGRCWRHWVSIGAAIGHTRASRSRSRWPTSTPTTAIE